jgi:hypothetical protein
MSLLNVVLTKLFVIDLLKRISQCCEKFKRYLMNFSVEQAILTTFLKSIFYFFST